MQPPGNGEGADIARKQLTHEGKNIMAVQIINEKCTGCGLCVNACPLEAISMQDDKAKVAKDKCTECGLCVEECPNEAISLP